MFVYLVLWKSSSTFCLPLASGPEKGTLERGCAMVPFVPDGMAGTVRGIRGGGGPQNRVQICHVALASSWRYHSTGVIRPGPQGDDLHSKSWTSTPSSRVNTSFGKDRSRRGMPVPMYLRVSRRHLSQVPYISSSLRNRAPGTLVRTISPPSQLASPSLTTQQLGIPPALPADMPLDSRGVKKSYIG